MSVLQHSRRRPEVWQARKARLSRKPCERKPIGLMPTPGNSILLDTSVVVKHFATRQLWSINSPSTKSFVCHNRLWESFTTEPIARAGSKQAWHRSNAFSTRVDVSGIQAVSI